MFLAFPYFVNLLCDFIHFDPTQKTHDGRQKSRLTFWQPFIPVSIFATPPCLSVLVNPLEQLATRWVAKPRLQRRREASCVSLPKGYSTLRNSPVMEARKGNHQTMPTTVTKMFTQTRFPILRINETEFKNIFTLVGTL